MATTAADGEDSGTKLTDGAMMGLEESSEMVIVEVGETRRVGN